MAELFLAKDTRDGRFVVLKRILPYMAEEAEFVRMFLDEARIAASLHHGNIVEVYELGRLENSTFIAMEWVDGVDLRRVLAKEQERGSVVPPGVAAWLVARLCEGLHYAHVRPGPDGKPLGIIHRDVSPQNVMVSFNADVKLVDFGIAKATAWMSRSKPGVIKGKFLYLAPEQLSQDKLDCRADLFAVGTLLYELTTGKSPFYRSSTEAVIYAIKMEDAQPPHTVRAGYPASLSKVVMKCLQRDRARRYQTADEIRQALEDFMRVDAPTTRNDVAKYVAGLFGADDERTTLYVPPNAQTRGDEERAEPPRPRSGAIPAGELKTDSSRPRPNNIAEITDERTEPIPRSLVKQAAMPEGRRPTSEFVSDPGEPEPTAVTAPMPSPVKAVQRDSATTAVLDDAPVKKVTGYAQAGADEVDQTAVSVSGARDLRVGDVLPELVPTRAMSRLEADSLPTLPPVSPSSRPPPPVPTGEIPEISDISVVSAGESTLAIDAGLLHPDPTPEPPRRSASSAENRRPPDVKRSPVLAKLPEAKGPDLRRPDARLPETRVAADAGDLERSPTEPRPPEPRAPEPRLPEARRPVPQPDKPARKPTSQQVRRAPKPVGDADDLINTVDMANASAFDEGDPRRKWILGGIIGVSALLVVLMLVWILSPAPRPKNTPPAKPVQIRFNAPKGTVVVIDGVTIEPGEVKQVTPGKLTYLYRCAVKSGKAKDEQASVVVAPSNGVQAFDVPCR